MPELKNNIVIGGGLAGLAAAYWARRQNPEAGVILLEKEPVTLAWAERFVRLPLLVGNTREMAVGGPAVFPRGWSGAGMALSQWPGLATRDWLESIGLPVYREEDRFLVKSGPALRDALVEAARRLGVDIRTDYAVENISRQEDGSFRVWSREGDPVTGARLLIATGGERNHGLKLASQLGGEAIPPLPGFVRLRLASMKAGEHLGPMECPVRLRCVRSGETAEGLLQISARGLEGPAVASLSARLCELWAQLRYELKLEIDWLPGLTGQQVRAELDARRQRGGRRAIADDPLFGLRARAWLFFLESARVEADVPWPRLKAKKLQALLQRLKADTVNVAGMGLPAGERAWAGGIRSDGVDGGTGEIPGSGGVYLGGEILDILGEPGGFHLNAIWATAYRAGSAMALRVS